MSRPSISDAFARDQHPSTVPELDAASVVPYFQPFYNLASGRLQGVEALARWRTADGAASMPPGFLNGTDASGRIREIDLHVLDQALSCVSGWRRSGDRPDLICSVNTSWDLVGHVMFVSEVMQALDRHHMSGDRLLVDLSADTFRMLCQIDDSALTNLRQLQELEVTFCLDGFRVDDLDLLEAPATVPVDIIKLHPATLAEHDQATATVELIARRVHDAGLPIVAAGIETPQQLKLVRELEFEWAQGFLLGAPVDAREVSLYASYLPAQ